jgi:hypothetical protein
MGQRLTFTGELNRIRGGAAKASPNRANESVGVDPKPSDLLMARMKVG